MSLYNQKHVLHVMVGKNVAGPADATLIDNYADLNDGAVAIVDRDNKAIVNGGSNIGDTEDFRFVTRVGTNLIYSPWLKNGNFAATSVGYTAAAAQVSYIGYAGSGSNTIEAIDNNEYIVRVLIEGTTALFGNKQMYKFGAYKSGNSALSSDIACGLVKNLNANFKREPEKMIVFEAVSSATTVATSGGAFTVTNGSTTVTTVESAGAAADAGKYNTDGSTLVAGDYIRFGHATTTTYPVYRVESITGGGTAAATIILDRPYQGATGTVSAANTGAMSEATGDAGYWGIKCTGQTLSAYRAGVFNYDVVRFKLEPANCGTTTVTYTTAANPGKGVYQQIQELQWFALGNLGAKYRVDTPMPVVVDQTSSASTYETIHIRYWDDEPVSLTGTTPKSYKEIVLAFVVNSACGDDVFATINAEYTLTAW